MKVGDIGSIIGAITGTTGNLKSPATYVGIAKIVGGIVGGPTGKIINAVTTPAVTTTDPAFVKEVEDGFSSLVQTINTQNATITALTSRVAALEAAGH